MPRPVYTALIHFPVIDKNLQLVSTSVTNLDIHDISRSARTYGIKGYYIVTPVEAQHWLVEQVVRHWQDGWGARYNSNRKDALSITRAVTDLEQVHSAIEAAEGQPPLWIATSARRRPNSQTFAEVRELISSAGPPLCLLFGTGWGIHPELMLEADLILEPIEGAGEFNHLSVRSAAAIVFDRLLSEQRDSRLT